MDCWRVGLAQVHSLRKCPSTALFSHRFGADITGTVSLISMSELQCCLFPNLCLLAGLNFPRKGRNSLCTHTDVASGFPPWRLFARGKEGAIISLTHPCTPKSTLERILCYKTFVSQKYCTWYCIFYSQT